MTSTPNLDRVPRYRTHVTQTTIPLEVSLVLDNDDVRAAVALDLDAIEEHHAQEVKELQATIADLRAILRETQTAVVEGLAKLTRIDHPSPTGSAL